MKSLIVIFCLSVYAICYADNNVYSGNPRDCRGPENKDLLTFEVLPGLGWDNLTNEEKGLVVNLNYSQCKTTEDGNYSSLIACLFFLSNQAERAYFQKYAITGQTMKRTLPDLLMPEVLLKVMVLR